MTKTAETRVLHRDEFGRDHASLLAYIETLVVDSVRAGVGEIDKRRVRCNPSNGRGHYSNCSAYGMPWEAKDGTRMASGEVLAAHDDWDCLDELESEGLVNVISAANGFVALTPKGAVVAERLRRHKSGGGSFATFDWRSR